MKKTHVIQDLATALYFKETHPGVHEPVATMAADFYSKEEAEQIALDYYKGSDAYEVKEGPAAAYMAWLGRKSAKVMTPAKRKAQAKRARGRKSKKLHWTWSKNKPKSAPII